MIIIELYKWAPMAKGSKALNLLASGRFFFMPFYLANCLFFAFHSATPIPRPERNVFILMGQNDLPQSNLFSVIFSTLRTRKTGKKRAEIKSLELH